jgi:hypothetical protein
MSALTRILNNQIFSKTIIASQKIADGTITGSLFSSNVTVPGDLLISGNLFVLGTSAYTTIASTNTFVNDPLITLNNGFAGTNTYDEGLIFNRGTLQNRAIIWSEYFQEFRLIGTTEVGTTYGNVVTSNFANLHIGNLIVDYTITNNGNTYSLEENQSTYIPKTHRHRLSNETDQILVMIEVQSGDYVGEDDIVRFDDYYGRTSND